jgi:hypothetical protein
VVTAGVLARLGPEDAPELLASLRAAFGVHRAELDALNVFPVPDGDTGANMLSTVVAACEANGDVASAVHGAVVGARGNSGVILSQALRALLEAVGDGLTGETVAAMLARADELARSSVAEPVEGTMLTALRVAAEAAADGSGGLPDRLAGLLPHVAQAVADTEFVLEQNRQAGVVDAGARGIEVWLRAIHDHVTGVAPAVVDDAEGAPGLPAPVIERAEQDAPTREQGSLEFRWEVQYLLDEFSIPDDEAVGHLKQVLTTLGDSVVVVSAGDLLNVHVHTNQIGAAVEAGLAIGHPRRVEVTDFEPVVDPDNVPVGIVAVLPGAVLADLVGAEQGVVVVDGRSGALPTVGSLLTAARAAHAHRVIVLPGHRNAVPTAHQVVEKSEAAIHVIARARSLPATIAALAVWDPAAEVDELVEVMDQAASHVLDGEVVAAVRDAETALGAVAAGDFLGLVDDQVVAVGGDPISVAREVLGLLAADGCELVTLVAGATAPASERDEVVAIAEDMGDDVELLVTDAEPARWWFGVE